LDEAASFEMKNVQQAPPPIIPWYFWAIVLGIVILWIATVPIVQWLGFGSPDGAGTFGDTFGALNTLFSGLAFLGVLAGIFIQGREFRSQLEEMRITASEMEKQSKIHDAQLETWRLQNELFRRQLCEAQIQERMSAEPFFKVSINCYANAGQVTISLAMINYAEAVFGVTLSTSITVQEFVRPVVKPNLEIQVLTMDFPPDDSRIKIVDLVFKYTTRLGHTRTQHFKVELVCKPHEPTLVQTDMALTAREIRMEVEEAHKML
jgi:hypothetical protein